MYTLDGRSMYTWVYPHGWGQYLDAMSLCIDCAGGFGGAEKVVRLWGAEFRLWVDEKHAPVFAVEVRAPVKVEHAEPGVEYYTKCCAVPLESMSIWQHMAHVACAAEDLLLRVAGCLRLKLKSALLGRLTETTIRRILAHLRSAILPPSRAHIERG